ncbi:adenine deaminase [Chitinophaga caeni]|uniref:Adenine deaminase n=1 Tax=Chitinophaga caeni TaxID=2029983 RepID=A0A291QQB1_9BACT|nr:adenine deaminase [Chitinophaga caeni]ATL46117.1 adenine deaminase [Chitinophaga caeni]
MNSFEIAANLIDIEAKRIFPAIISVDNGMITAISPTDQPVENFILPGFIDAHVHIESSMLIPSEFARLASIHGTVATVSDPHEIANVLGIKGVEFMLDNAKKVPFYFNFGAPSCVPATSFETAGAAVTAGDVDALLQRDDIKYLSEMMNFPGVLHKDPDVMQKIAAARKYGKPVDGHAPGLTGEAAREYVAAGINTDHECFTAGEALEKLDLGMKILIREGSAAKNFDALAPLIPKHADNMMFCSDDKHPDSLLEGHINVLVKRSLDLGYDLYDVLKMACINPVQHYDLASGTLKVGHPADFIIVDNTKDFNVLKTFVKGELIAENGKTFIRSVYTQPINQFNTSMKSLMDFEVRANDPASKNQEVPVIVALDGQLITLAEKAVLPVLDGLIHADLQQNVLKIAVVNRYQDAPVAVGFVKNFGLKKGAIASSIAHDSHNIIVVGVDDKSIVEAVNLIIDGQGGISVSTTGRLQYLPLPVAGLMSHLDAFDIASQYTQVDSSVKKDLGSTLEAPFMTLSFMALLVIPHLKLSDLGLFNGDTFQFV